MPDSNGVRAGGDSKDSCPFLPSGSAGFYTEQRLNGASKPEELVNLRRPALGNIPGPPKSTAERSTGPPGGVRICSGSTWLSEPPIFPGPGSDPQPHRTFPSLPPRRSRTTAATIVSISVKPAADAWIPARLAVPSGLSAQSNFRPSTARPHLARGRHGHGPVGTVVIGERAHFHPQDVHYEHGAFQPPALSRWSKNEMTYR